MQQRRGEVRRRSSGGVICITCSGATAGLRELSTVTAIPCSFPFVLTERTIHVGEARRKGNPFICCLIWITSAEGVAKAFSWIARSLDVARCCTCKAGTPLPGSSRIVAGACG